MQAAYELGIEFDRPIILGDQDIDTTNDRLKASLKKSFTDIINPVDGWKSIVQDQVPKAASHQQGMKSIAIQ